MNDDKIISVSDNSLDNLRNLDDHPGLKLFADKARELRNLASSTKTNPEYIKWKSGGFVGGKEVFFPYPTQAYMFAEFNRLYPLHKIKLISTKFIPEVFSVEVALEITVLPIGVTEIGVGASRVQIKKKARELAEAGEKMPTPFDVISYDMAVKSARTQAKKDGIKEFDVCADIYDRVIIPEEVSNLWNSSYKKLVDENILSPVDKMNWMKRWENEPLKGRGDLLKKAMEHFGIEVVEPVEESSDDNT